MSRENAERRQSISIDPRYVGRLAGTLLGICLATALLLGVVNQVTKPRIDAIQREKQEAAADGVTALYRAFEGAEPAGYVVQVTANGSQGAIQMMVGVDVNGAVTGVSVIKHSETPNIGTKVVADQAVLDRFIGMSHDGGEITVNTGNNRFDGVTGATYSSRGVADGVNAALAAVAALS